MVDSEVGSVGFGVGSGVTSRDLGFAVISGFSFGTGFSFGIGFASDKSSVGSSSAAVSDSSFSLEMPEKDGVIFWLHPYFRKQSIKF